MVNWIKQNKLPAIIIAILMVLLVRNNSFPSPLMKTSSPAYRTGSFNVAAPQAVNDNFVSKSLPSAGGSEYTPTTTTNRLVVQDSTLSMVVKDVRQVSDKVVEYAKQNEGFMVNENFSSPQEAPFATISVRVPSNNLPQILTYYRGLALKVTSENLTGTDVTDQYVDIEARLKTLNTTKTKFEEIMAKAVTVQDILNVQRELISLQDQIDGLKGQQDFLKKTAELAKVTVYLSTDEFSLPYAPSDTFRPEVIFKTAVRSLVSTLRGLVENLIWIAVFSVIWIPTLIIGILIYKWYQKRSRISRVN
jgi:hypothetical protein